MDASAIVTGGTGGLGSAVVARLLEDGWRVIVPWVAEHELERLGEHARLQLIHADLFDPEAVRTVVTAAADDPERPLRGLVNLVGGFAMGARVRETPIEEFEAQFRLNLRPTYLMTQAALGPMLEDGGGGAGGATGGEGGGGAGGGAEGGGNGAGGAGGGGGGAGSIVCVGTRAALQPFPGAAGYIASKAAVIAFAQAVAAEYRQDGLRCNVILPSVIDTPANRASMPDAKHERWVKPAEIAGVIAHLLSADSAPTSGAAIPVYGRA